MSNLLKDKRLLLGIVFITILIFCFCIFICFSLFMPASFNIQGIDNTLEVHSEEFYDENYSQKVVLSEEESTSENVINEIEVSTQDAYYIKVNTLANTVNVYKYDITGNYLVPFNAFVCSIGEDTPLSRYLFN